MNSNRSLAVLLSAALLASCDGGGIQQITAPAPASAVKFFNFGISAPAVNFYANTTKVTAVSSTSCVPPTNPVCLTTGIEATTGVGFGGAGTAGLYNGMTPGAYTLTGRIATTADNGVAISSTPATIEAGKYYSYYVSGFYDAASKKADGFVVTDDFPVPLDPTKTYIRFVNAIANSQPMTLYVKNQAAGTVEAPVGGAVAYKGASPFVAFTGGGVVDYSTRLAGSATNLIVRTGILVAPGHAYTITAYGDMTVTSTTAATRPQLDNTANR
jgi:hypothetical protein